KGLISFMYIVNTFYLPDISKNIKDRKFLRNYLYSTRIQLVITVSFFAVVGFFLSPLMFSFFDESYSEAALVFQVLLIGVVFKFWSIFYNPLFNVIKKYKF